MVVEQWANTSGTVSVYHKYLVSVSVSYVSVRAPNQIGKKILQHKHATTTKMKHARTQNA
jgi:hypothetical protein